MLGLEDRQPLPPPPSLCFLLFQEASRGCAHHLLWNSGVGESVTSQHVCNCVRVFSHSSVRSHKFHIVMNGCVESRQVEKQTIIHGAQ